MPGILVGVLLARVGGPERPVWGRLMHEVLLGKSIVLLLGGLSAREAFSHARSSRPKPSASLCKRAP